VRAVFDPVRESRPGAGESPRLDVAVVTETYPPEVNGVAMTLGRMVSALRARSHRVQLVRPRQGRRDAAAVLDGFEEVLRPGVPIPRYEMLRLGLPARRSLLQLWRRARPDVVQVVTEGPLGWSAVSAARTLGIPVATDFHTNFHSYSGHYGVGWLRKPIAAYLRAFHNRAMVTLVPTREMQALLHGTGYRNVRVVSRGVDTVLFCPRRRSRALRGAWGAADEDTVFLYVGRLAPEKNLPLVFSAFDRVRARDPRAKLVLVGDGPLRAPLAARHPHVTFAGMRTGEDLAQHYASGDVFLFPSLTETFGNVTLEAMASGLAVVAYDYAAAREHIRDGVSGLLAAYGDAAAFEARAVELAGARERTAGLGAGARVTAVAVAWERVYDDLENVLASLAGRTGAAVASAPRPPEPA
jgi:glycosyltransferase involved in cell wall biosynthesis